MMHMQVDWLRLATGWAICLLLLLAQSACVTSNRDGAPVANAPPELAVVDTAVPATAVSPTAAPTRTPLPPTPTITPTPFPTTTAAAPANASDCRNDAAFVADVTLPDNSIVEAEESLLKTWRLRNSGDCIWLPGYSVAYAQGEALAWTPNGPLPIVEPGAEVEVSLTLTAPQAPGVYRTWWRLQDQNQELFGESFYVLFEVPELATDIPGHGVVQGAIRYPAAAVPAMTIYFLSVDGGQRFALETESGWSRYLNTLPVGDYYVFARVTGEEGAFGGGYTQAVLCGLQAHCTDHALVLVTVVEGRATRNVDVADWYAPEGAFPLP
jgi:hypothetical protein